MGSATLVGGNQPSRCAMAWNALTHSSASNATRIGNASAIASLTCVAWKCGVTSSTTNGSAIRLPACLPIGPKRRSQIDAEIAATNVAAPVHGIARSNSPTPSAATLTSGSAIAASMRPRRSRSSWLRDSDRHSTTPSTAGPGSGSTASAHAIVASAASMVATASRSEARINWRFKSVDLRVARTRMVAPARQCTLTMSRCIGASRASNRFCVENGMPCASIEVCSTSTSALKSPLAMSMSWCASFIGMPV